MAKPNGYILRETEDVVIIATTKSANVKTGDMIQIWILNRNENPVEAVRSGANKAICFDCPHMGDGFIDRTCYVNVGQGPNAVYRAYRNGKYPFLSVADYGAVFTNRKVRFGAYGEPVLIPLHIFEAITAVCFSEWTGYTHQWRRPEFQEYRHYLMASCDSPSDRTLANAMQWRTFRVRGENEPLAHGEIVCPASSEAGHRTTCENCLLCNGSRGVWDARKDIAIVVHGSGSKNFVSLASIA